MQMWKSLECLQRVLAKSVCVLIIDILFIYYFYFFTFLLIKFVW